MVSNKHSNSTFCLNSKKIIFEKCVRGLIHQRTALYCVIKINLPCLHMQVKGLPGLHLIAKFCSTDGQGQRWHRPPGFMGSPKNPSAHTSQLNPSVLLKQF